MSNRTLINTATITQDLSVAGTIKLNVVTGGLGLGSLALLNNLTGVALGTPSSGGLANCTGLPIGGLTGLGIGVGTALGANVTGSGGIALATSPIFISPSLGVAAGTSLALGGATIGTDALGITGTMTISGNAVFNSNVNFGASTGISLISAGVLALGNGAAGDASGTLQVTTINGQSSGGVALRLTVNGGTFLISRENAVTGALTVDNRIRGTGLMLGVGTDCFIDRVGSGSISIGSTAGGVDGALQIGSLRINQAPTAVSSAAAVGITSAADGATNIGHRISVNMNGVTYWIPASTTAF